MLDKSVLIVEDDSLVRNILKVTLERAGCSVSTAENGVKALEVLQTSFPDIVVTDWMMPEMDGKELCTRLRLLKPDQYMYVILMTAHSKFVDLVDALGAGADEYITKPIKPEELVARIVAASRFLDVDRELRKQVTVDTLTESLNRRTFMEVLGREHEKFLRYDQPLSLLMMDIDSFKSVNAQYGKTVGNTVLKSVAQVAATKLRNIGYVGRMDGDKFCMLLPNTDQKRAVACAESIRTKIEDLMIVTEGASIGVTVSLGIAHADATTPTDIKLVKRAAQSLLLAKQAGRNLVGPSLTSCDVTDPVGTPDSLVAH